MIRWAELSAGERSAFVREKWAEGLSASKIAALTVGASRNAIISNVHRQGLKRDPATSRLNFLEAIPRSRPFRSPKPRLIIAGCGAVLEKPPAAPSTFIPKPDAFKPLAGSRPIPWTERGFGQCAWPVDVEAEEQHSCALRCADGETYCATHLKLRTAPQAPGKPKRSPQELIRALRRYA